MESESPLNGSPSPTLATGNGCDGSPRSRKRSGAVESGGKSHHTAKRRKIACQPCSLRKIKCDAARPQCAICQANDTRCEYRDERAKLTLESATQTICERLDKLQSTINSSRVNQPQHRSKDQLRRTRTHSEGAQTQPAVIEPSKDFLQIPPHTTTADAVLTWEVFTQQHAPNALIEVLFQRDTNSIEEAATAASRSGEVFTAKQGLKAPDEEQVTALVDGFLRNVHTKNPVLDVESLVKQGRRIAVEGFGWDAWSCLVMIACALGTIAKPFDAAIVTATDPQLDYIASPNIASFQPDAVPLAQHQAESYFVLACRRLGTLKHGLLGAQCHFFAGVYLMYTLRPLLSYQYFIHSSAMYQLYMKTTYGVHDVALAGHSSAAEKPDKPASSKRCRLEQSLYWSCFKSESEFRVELPLSQSEIATYHPPHMFPSPPSPPNVDLVDTQMSPLSAALPDPSFDHIRRLTNESTSSSFDREAWELRQHAKQLCNEEESWYYYLTEIAIRRIGNRIINTFFRQDHASWLNVKPLLRIALEFDTQLSSWSANLPQVMKHYETTYTIRAPAMVALNDGTANHVSRELSWAIDNRLLEARSWLYQPFLYYLIHSSDISPAQGHAVYRNSLGVNGVDPVTPGEASFAFGRNASDTDEESVLLHLIAAGVECNLKIIDVRSLRHRHHGLWYDLRSLMTASLILLALVKSGHEAWIPGGAELLWGSSIVTYDSLDQHSMPSQAIRGKIGHVLGSFNYWSTESSDMVRHYEVLEATTREVRSLWESRRP